MPPSRRRPPTRRLNLPGIVAALIALMCAAAPVAHAAGLGAWRGVAAEAQAALSARQFARAESLLAAHAASAADEPRTRAQLDALALLARAEAPGACDSTWLERPAAAIAALERLRAERTLLAQAWNARARVEYRLGVWPRALEAARTAVALAERLPRACVRERVEARLTLAEVLGTQDHVRSAEQLVVADSLLRVLADKGAGADLRPRALRLSGMVALMESRMGEAARLLGAAIAAADSLQPPADADAGLAMVFLGQAEAQTDPARSEQHRTEAARRMEARLGLVDERTLLVLGRSVQNSRDPSRLPASDARFEAARAELVARGLGESSAAWDLDYFQSRIKFGLGRLLESRALLTHAIAVSRRWQGPGNIREMFANIDMGNTYFMRREPLPAEPWYRAAVEIGARLPVSLANDLNVTRTNLANVLSFKGDLRGARDEFAAVYESYRARFGPTSRRSTVSAQQAGRISRALGDTAQADLWYARAMATLPPGGGIEPDEVGNARESYALYSYWAGRYERGFEAALLPARVRRQIVEETVPWLLDGDALRFASSQRMINGVLQSIALRDPSASPAMRADVWTEMALGRGALLESMLHRARAAGDTLGAAGALRRELARAVLAALRTGDNAAAQHRRDSLRTAIRALERGGDGGSANTGPALSPASVSAQLGRGALVSYLRFSYFDKADASAGLVWSPRDRYLAFVLTGDSASLALVDLGRADSLDAAIARWRGARGDSARATGAALRALVWDPVAPYLAGRTDVHLVPDGELQKLNFYALPVGADRFLVDENFVLHRHASERELLLERARPPGAGLLAMGGVDYDRAGAAPATAAAPAARRLLPSCRAFVDERFAPLGATLAEVSAVAAIARGNTGGAAQVLAGQQADEAAFKRLAPGRRVVHLATHSFFLGADCASGAASGAAGGGGAAGAADVLAQNPLVFSGIALAGANQWPDAAARGGEDNLLTAEELCGLDLHGVEWLVLSGCESGLGQVQAWEGVYGLPRAARQAGVRSLIMSLAPVDDETARAWMSALYQAHFVRHESTALAVRTASRAVLGWLRTHGRSSEPSLWGAFVALGD